MSETINQKLKYLKYLFKDKRLYLWLIILVVLFFFFFLKTNENTPFTPVEKSAKVKIGSINTVSLSPDQQLMGILSNDYGDAIILHILKTDGELIFKRSLEELNPHIVVSSYEMTFSPDNKFAAFFISDKEDNFKSRLVLVDLDKKQIVDLSEKDRLGDLAYTYEPHMGPVWLSTSTIAYTHRVGSYDPQELIFVNLDTSKEVAPRKKFSHTPVLSNTGEAIAYWNTGDQGIARIYIADINSIGYKDMISISDSEPFDGNFRHISSLKWSPDDKYLAFSYTDDKSTDQGIAPVAVYSVSTKKLVYKIEEYLSKPQWIDSNILSAGYYEFTPFYGQITHTFRKIVFFNVTEKKILDKSISVLNNNVLFLKNNNKFISVLDGRIMSVDLARVWNPRENSIFLSKIVSFGKILRKNVVDLFRREDRWSIGYTKTDLNTKKWLLYKNDSFGLSFKYPPNWELSEASGDGYMNLQFGNGSDGIYVELTGVDGEVFNEENLRKTIYRDSGIVLLSNSDVTASIGINIEQISFGENDFLRFRKPEELNGGFFNYSYYLNKPLYSEAFPDLADVLIFKVNSSMQSSNNPDPNGDYNPSHIVLKEILSTLKVENRPSGLERLKNSEANWLPFSKTKMDKTNKYVQLTFPNDGVKWVIQKEDGGRAVSEYGQEIQLAMDKTLTLFTRHDSLTLQLVFKDNEYQLYVNRVLDKRSVGGETEKSSYYLPADSSYIKTNTQNISSPKIFSLSPISGPAGMEVKISGSGFSKINSVIIIDGVREYAHLDGLKSEDGKVLTFIIPENIPCADKECLGIEPGRYEIIVSNEKGNSAIEEKIFTFLVTLVDIEDKKTSPVIQKLIPTKGPVGTNIQVIGTGFSPKNLITIRNSSGAQTSLNDVESFDGKTMIFKIPPVIITYPTSSSLPLLMTNIVPGIYELVVGNKGWEETSKPMLFEVTN